MTEQDDKELKQLKQELKDLIYKTQLKDEERIKVKELEFYKEQYKSRGRFYLYLFWFIAINILFIKYK